MKIKRRTKILIGLVTVCAASLSFAAACSSWDTPFDKIEKDGFTATVRYDINGGQFASADNRNIVDVFKLDDAQKGVKLAEPGSEERGKGQKTSVASRSGYFLAGWYRERTEVTDSAGNVLDESGKVWVEGQPKQYKYSGKWDFANDVFKVSSSEEQSCTLYAAWIPNFNFNFMAKNDGGEWTQVASYTINPLVQSRELRLPYWDDEQPDADPETCSPTMTYGSFPEVIGKTFSKAFLDKSMTDEAHETITHAGIIDYETGTAIGGNEEFYLELLDGTWYHIHTEQQLSDYASTDGCYVIMDDLTFDSDSTWETSFTTGVFTGKFIGNGHTFSGINIRQVNANQLRGGVFGRIAAGAEISDLNFENVVYKIDAATRLGGGEFGLFAGSIDATAKFTGVTVTGTLRIGDMIPNYDNYSVGLLSSTLNTVSGITHTINLELDQKSDLEKIYPHKVTVTPSGLLIFTENENPEQKPEIEYLSASSTEVL